MTGPIATPVLPDDPRTRRALLDLTTNMSREGISGFSYAVPLYQDEDLVRVVAEEEYDAGPVTVNTKAPSWQTLLTATLALERDVSYRIHGTASLDIHLEGGAFYETLALRVNDGTNTLHTLYGSSTSVEQYVPITVPFTLQVEATSSVAFTMDGQHVLLSGGGSPIAERIRLIVVAVPIKLEGAGA